MPCKENSDIRATAAQMAEAHVRSAFGLPREPCATNALRKDQAFGEALLRDNVLSHYDTISWQIVEGVIDAIERVAEEDAPAWGSRLTLPGRKFAVMLL